MTTAELFPFGQPVQDVVQTDRAPKRVFVLGVYSSAVHARWLGPDGSTWVKALAVASEPYIFWRGDGAAGLIQSIVVPPECGRLEPAARLYNGPSGAALDDLILAPLGLARADAWLCDLVPRSCQNAEQKRAIVRHYLPVARRHGLPLPSVSSLPPRLIDEARRAAIWDEIEQSGAGTLILLGDQPIHWFLAPFDPRWDRLADFMQAGQPYGQLHATQINGKSLDVLPLAHPRQIAGLGLHSRDWRVRHQTWMRSAAGLIQTGQP